MMGKYDYSKFVYVNNHTKAIVICPVHGEFLISPANHIIAKCGCPHCGNQRPKGYWTLERCKEESLKFNYKREWARGSSYSYDVARRNNWLDECCGHMTKYNRFKP